MLIRRTSQANTRSNVPKIDITRLLYWDYLVLISFLRAALARMGVSLWGATVSLLGPDGRISAWRMRENTTRCSQLSLISAAGRVVYVLV